MRERSNTIRERITPRRTMAMLASAAAFSTGLSTEKAFATPSLPAQEKQPQILPTGVESTSCKDRHGLVVSLRGRHNVRLNEKEHFTLLVKSCKKTGEPYTDVSLRTFGPQNQLKSLKISKLRYKEIVKKKVRFIFAKSSQSPALSGALQASKGDKRLKTKLNWELNYAYMGASGGTPVNVMPVMPETCTPRNDFYIGVQDDPQIVYQQDVSREATLQIAKEKFGATALRINVIYGQVKAHGYQPTIEAIEAAKKRGFTRFHITIMPTPSYMSYLDSTYSYNQPDLEVAKQFTQEVLQTLTPHGVTSVSPINEPNHPYFFTPQTPDAYMPFAQASYSIVKSINPNIEVYPGELAPGSSDTWIPTLNTIPNDGISLHPYGVEMLKAQQHTKWSKTPIVYTEYGNSAYDPEQTAKNNAAIAVARCVGAKAIFFYQMIRTGKPWNTGINNTP